MNSDKLDEVMIDIGVKQICLLSPTLFGCILMNLKYIWTRSMGNFVVICHNDCHTPLC